MLAHLRYLKVISLKALRRSLEDKLKERLQENLKELKDMKAKHLEIIGKKFPKISELKEVAKEIGVKDGVAILGNLPLLCVMGALAGSLLIDEILYSLISKKEVKT